MPDKSLEFLRINHFKHLSYFQFANSNWINIPYLFVTKVFNLTSSKDLRERKVERLPNHGIFVKLTLLLKRLIVISLLSLCCCKTDLCGLLKKERACETSFSFLTLENNLGDRADHFSSSVFWIEKCKEDLT